MVTSVITILLTNGMFPTVVIPLISTCFFEIGTAAIIETALAVFVVQSSGLPLRGSLPSSRVGFGAYFFSNTIQQWMLVYGEDFDLWGIVCGSIARLIA